MKQSMTYIERIVTALVVVMLVVCCADYDAPALINGDIPLTVSGEINQMAVSRVNDSGFADGDRMGIYVVDYEGNTPGTLEAEDNRATNVCHTFDERQGRWTPSRDIYWRDDHTHADIYAYYPYDYTNPSEVDNYPFELQSNQDASSDSGVMGGYEASDFLWCKVADVAPTTSTVRLPLSHIMSSARILLEEGTGFDTGEWERVQKQIVVTNTRRKCSIDLSTGAVNTTGMVESTATVPARRQDEWRAIVLPQTIEAGTTMFAITVDGVPYKFTKNTDFTFLQGKLSTFTIVVDKIVETGKYKLTLTNESIIDWENDLFSHDATAREYLIVHSTAGGLRNAIASLGKDYTRIKNMKITGTVNASDFYFMRDSMTQLQSLNMREMTIAAGLCESDWGETEGQPDRIPAMAFHAKTSLLRIILPERLKIIGQAAFDECISLSGSLDIPEGVTRIEASAFCYCFSLTGTLTLPSTLEYIGGGGSVYGLGAFTECGFISELKIPERVTYIGHNAFNSCRGLYGELHLPHGLKTLHTGAFAHCSGLTGSLDIPHTLANVGECAFEDCGFDGNLYIPDGVVSVGKGAFVGTHLRGELSLPKSLEIISESAFANCDFSGTLKLPESLSMIGPYAFANNWRLSGVVAMPETMRTIGAGAFRECRGLEGIELNDGLEAICSNSQYGGAFLNCYGLASIVSHCQQPPLVQQGAFDGVPKDNFTVEVPERSLMQYQTAIGWTDFKRIAAHHELVCRPSVACALGSRHKQVLTIDAEGEWEVESMPSWCSISPSSGNRKTTATLTINELHDATANRTGEIVFRLKGKDYRHTCSVSQCGYQYAEDEVLTLQKASRGKNGGINVVFVGDGYDAEDISSGTYLRNIKQEVEYLFAIEPYATYRDYFNIYTMFPLSAESGVGTVNTIRYNRFGTTFTGGVGLRAEYDDIFSYVKQIPTVSDDNLAQTLIVVIPNSTEYGGITQMWTDGRAIAFCPMSNYEYPYDTRGVVQHEAGGHGFGKLADEYIYHNAFIDACNCVCCGHADAVSYGKSLGWYDNISLTNKAYSVPWAHLLTDARYSDVVDIFEGGYMHSRGVFRSEQNSCMNNDIPYFSAISRESIVRRIKRYAGEPFSFDDFAANDKAGVAAASKGSHRTSSHYVIGHGRQMAPVIHRQ